MSIRKTSRTGTTALLLTVLLLLTIPSPLPAHDVPAEVVIHAFVKPDGNKLHFLLRLPLILLADMNLPQKGPGYLALGHIEPALKATIDEAAILIDLYEDGHLLTKNFGEARISRPSNKSFSSYTEALSHIAGPKLSEDTNVFWNQGFFDAHLVYPIDSDQSTFSVDLLTTFGVGNGLKTSVRFMPPDGSTRAYELVGGGERVNLDPRWHQAAWVFIKAGFFHILNGTDHLLFLLCLVIPLKRFRPLIFVVTAFTVAHSVTLIMSAYELGPSGRWFPPLVESLIAASIVYMAIENVIGANLRRRWITALLFGLVHGFGFSFTLRETLQFAGSHLLVSLLSFNVGVELGQVLALTLVVPALVVLFRYVVAEKVGTIILSVLIVHTAWHWMSDRTNYLWQVGLPIPDVIFISTYMGWVVGLFLAAGLLWFWTGHRWRRPIAGTVRSKVVLPG